MIPHSAYSPDWSTARAASRLTLGGSQRLPAVAASTAILVVASFLTSNPFLTSASVLCIAGIVWLLWRPSEPPVLVLAAGIQWLQVATKVLLADSRGVSVTSLSISRSVEEAIWLGLIGLIVLSLGMRLGVSRLPLFAAARDEGEAAALSLDRVFQWYLVSFVFAAGALYVSQSVLPLAQILQNIAAVKWMLYFVLGYATLRRKTKVGYFVVATVLEILGGIGFFSDFKVPLLVASLVIFSLHLRITWKTVLVGIAAASVTIFAALTWMSIREEYRAFLNQGTRQQVILVSPVQQLTEFADLVSEVNASSVLGSVDAVLERVAYVDFFGAVLDYVPSHRSFENGGFTWRALEHILVPRFLYPEKEILESDSEVTMRYTGLTVASSDRGTSIGLGYMAEAYIDFGRIGMFVPIFVFGILWGRMYAWLISRSRIGVIGLGFGTTLMLYATQFEISEVKLIGGMIARFLILAVIVKYVMPKFERHLVRTDAHLRFLTPRTGASSESLRVPPR